MWLRIMVASFSLLGLLAAEIQAQAVSARDALRELRALKSVATAGPTIEQYSARVLDAKIAVDRYLDASARADPVPLRRAIRLATKFFLLASWSWRTGMGLDAPNVWTDKEALAACPQIEAFFEGALKAGKEKLEEGTITAEEARIIMTRTIWKEAVPVYWACADRRIAEVETLLRGR